MYEYNRKIGTRNLHTVAHTHLALDLLTQREYNVPVTIFLYFAPAGIPEEITRKAEDNVLVLLLLGCRPGFVYPEPFTVGLICYRTC